MAISSQDRSELIALARAAVESHVKGLPAPDTDNFDGVLGEQRGCFVTLTNAGQLRGCIGTFAPRSPLAKTIVDMCSEAARDPRFLDNPITPAEIAELMIQVSVLSPLAQTDQPHNLRVGTHGIYIISGNAGGCFLPEVATDMGWTAEQFLDNCCTHKAGLPAGAWREPNTEVYLFTSEKFQQ